MSDDSAGRHKILMLGLDDALARELGQALNLVRAAVETAPECRCTKYEEVLRESEPELVFFPSKTGDLSALMQALAGCKRKPPVVVVSRQADVTEWLDAIEAGASDYCTAPFEPAQMRWILESNRRSAA